MSFATQTVICGLIVGIAAVYLLNRFGVLQLLLPKRLLVRPDVRTSALVRKRR